MQMQQLTGKIGAAVRGAAWWVLIGPFCWATALPALGATTTKPLHLSAEPERFPVTELLGRLTWFRGRMRLARSVIILLRALLLCALILLIAKGLEVVTRQPISPWLPLVLFLVAGWAIHLSLHHPISPFDVARFVDRRVQLRAQIATAVELTTDAHLDQPLVRTQVRLATNRLRDLDARDTIPLVFPGRDFQLLGVTVIVYALMTYVGTLGINLPRPVASLDAEVAKQASQQVQAPSPFITMDASGAPLQTTAPPALGAQSSSGQVANQLNSLRQQLQSQQITQQQYDTAVKQIEQQVQAQASQSLAAQDALNALAAALKDSSATSGISDSLNRGDYSGASNQLNQLSQQLSQLSPAAQSQLANQLANASQQTQKTSQPISRDSGQAAQALQQSNTAQASQAMQSLAQSVQQASQQIQAQSQLGQELQSAQQQLGSGQGQQSAQSAQNAGASSDSNSQSSAQDASAGADPGQQGLQSEQAGAAGVSNTAANQANSMGTSDGGGNQSAAQSSTGQIQSDQSGAGGGAGNQPGGSALGAGGNSLDVQGVRLTIVGKPNDSGSSSTQAGNRSIPLTSAGASTLNSMAGSGSVPSNVPINVHQENNVVPLDRKPVVREYFTDAGQ